MNKVIPVSPANNKKLRSEDLKDVSKSRIIRMLKSDIRSILVGTYVWAEIAKYQASIDLAWLKRLFTDLLAQ